MVLLLPLIPDSFFYLFAWFERDAKRGLKEIPDHLNAVKNSEFYKKVIEEK